MIRRHLLLLALAFPAATLAGPPAGLARVKLDTSMGAIVIAVDTRHAPITAANFLRYVDEKRFDYTTFYRAARAPGSTSVGLVEGGIQSNMMRALPPIRHEPTTLTGLHHGDGTVSMGRDAPGTAMGDFFITVGPSAYLDASRGDPGYAAFGHVVGGMDVVRKMLASPTYKGGWSKETHGQSIVKPIRILTARRVP